MRLLISILLGFLISFGCESVLAQALLRDLGKPIEGRSMRASSTFRKGADGKYDPKADPLGDNTEDSNEDCFWVKPGETHVALDAKGPGAITHIWFTFFPPEPHE
jgi:hypothetical protein